MNAAAFVVGTQDGAAAALTTLAQNAGLEPVLPYRSLAKAEAQMQVTPLVFFLCTAVADVAVAQADGRCDPLFAVAQAPILADDLLHPQSVARGDHGLHQYGL